MLREVGCLITAIVVAGRSGSAFTAQIGTMKLNQEVDAMQTIGLNTVEILVLPRLLGLMVALPLLTFFANIMGLIGGAVMCNLHLGITVPAFLRQLHDVLTLNSWTFWLGLIKAPVYAFLIALVGCFEGLRVEGNAGSVGRQTTRAVVESIFVVIVFDAAFSILFVAGDLAMVMRKKPKRAPPSSEEVVIKIRGLVNEMAGNLIHDNLDLDVKRGEVLGVVGGSGSGKSVLLRSIIGLNKPTDGMIRVLGEDIGELHGQHLRALQMRWGVLFQEGALFSSQTVAENIQVPLREYTHMSQQLMEEIAAMKLAMVGLPEDAARKYPSQLSGGMKKRAGLSRALALDPEIVFLDEPTAGLDPFQRRNSTSLSVDCKRASI
jgi:phospholipid/cholesterol/gamma-HCH transport system ATP-binding protein